MPLQCIGNSVDGDVLPHHPLVQRLGQRQQLGALGRQQLGDGDASPAGRHLRYVRRCHLLPQHALPQLRRGNSGQIKREV